MKPSLSIYYIFSMINLEQDVNVQIIICSTRLPRNFSPWAEGDGLERGKGVWRGREGGRWKVDWQTEEDLQINFMPRGQHSHLHTNIHKEIATTRLNGTRGRFSKNKG